MQVARTEQPDQPVAQVLALQQDEDRDDEDDGRGQQRRDDGCEDPLGELHGRRLRLVHLDRDHLRLVPGGRVRRRRARFGGLCGVGIIELTAKPANDRGHAAEQDLLCRVDLLLNGTRIARHVRSQFGELGADHRRERQDDTEGQHHGQQHGWHTAQVHASQQVDQWGQQEREQHRQDDRDHHLAAEIQSGHDHDCDRQSEQALHPWRVGGRHLNGGPVRGNGQVRHGSILQSGQPHDGPASPHPHRTLSLP